MILIIKLLKSKISLSSRNSLSLTSSCCRMGLHTVIPMGKAPKIKGSCDPRAEARGYSFHYNLLNLK